MADYAVKAILELKAAQVVAELLIRSKVAGKEALELLAKVVKVAMALTTQTKMIIMVLAAVVVYPTLVEMVMTTLLVVAVTV